MVSIKKIALAVIALGTLGLNGVASAAMYTPAPAPAPACTADNVTVPCEKTAWDVGIQALYVQTNSIEGVTQTTTFDTNTTNIAVQDFRPDWIWGFRLEGSYHWSTGNDLNLNWTHFSKSDSVTSNFATGSNQFFDGGFVVDGDNGDWNSIVTSVDQKFDAVNLEFGQRVNFGEHVSARFHAGLQYARIEQDITQSGAYTTSFIEGDIAATATSNSKFSGIGPRLGFDLMYDCGNGFAIVGSTAGSLLVGDTDLDLSSSVTSLVGDPATTVTTTATASTSEREIVPGLEAKLGLQYTHPCPQGDFIIQGGYQVANYWNSVERGAVSSTVLASQNLGASLGTTLGFGDENFAFQGVYLGVKWIGNC